MAKILAIVEKAENETDLDFKERICKVMAKIDDPKAFAIGRFEKTGDTLKVSCLWGMAYPELPSETCYIASYQKAECQSNYLRIEKGGD